MKSVFVVKCRVPRHVSAESKGTKAAFTEPSVHKPLVGRAVDLRFPGASKRRKAVFFVRNDWNTRPVICDDNFMQCAEGILSKFYRHGACTSIHGVPHDLRD